MKKNKTVDVILEQLEEGVKAVYSSENWKNFLAFQSKFRSYSFSNAVFIFSQLPSANHVAGFKKWQEMGRQVRKGEQAIKILAPLVKKKLDEKSGEDKKVIYGFRYVNVFDISQTSGKPVPELCQELTGTDEEYIRFYETVKQLIPLKVKEKTIASGAKGYYNRERNYIAIKKEAMPEQKAKTLIHEYAHAVLHNKDQERETTRSMREVEAESTAFVVLNYFGFDTSNYSFPYVAGWNGTEEDMEQIKKAGKVIQKTANEFIEQIEKSYKVKENKEIA